MAKVMGVGAVTAGGVALGIGAALLVSASRLHDSTATASGIDRVTINEQIASRNRWAAVSALGGATLAAGGVGLLIWGGRAAGKAD
jgi:hypothetical protein